MILKEKEDSFMNSKEARGTNCSTLSPVGRPVSSATGRLSSAGRRSDVNISVASVTDEELSFSDSDDEGVTPSHQTNEKFWNSFGESLKRINDDSGKFLIRPKPNFKSSFTFQGAMTETCGNTQYGSSRGYTKLKETLNRLTDVSGAAARMFVNATKPKEDITSEETQEIDEEEKPETGMKEITSALGGAKRSWKLIKRNVNETAMEKKTEKTKLNWDMLAHHAKGLTDLERSRQDLYQRYGLLPMLHKDGSYECRNIMWSERAIRLNMTNPIQYNVITYDKRRAQSAKPRSKKPTPKLTIQRPSSEKPHSLRTTSASTSRTGRVPSAGISGRTMTRPAAHRQSDHLLSPVNALRNNFFS
ncbi:uncharacterized protein LOC133200928 [Saccostrea echinata]|uniref:uncharacterized protein LOC133200928 n=1 Tax=Saccostrea echinata TaxID=191078 RepID=UPI002A807BDB|nr:uncharacterized protein LOC133200928 [Saccostrea echinata]